MARLFALILLTAIVLAPSCASTDKLPVQKLPLVLVFACPIGDEEISTDSSIVAAVAEQLAVTGRADAFIFSPDLPIVTRALMEGRLSEELLSRASDPRSAVQIANALGAQYALRVRGSATGGRIEVILELLKAPGGGRWESSAWSEIGEIRGQPGVADRRNAVSNAASSAVSQVVIAAFGQATGLGPPDSVQRPQIAPSVEPSASDEAVNPRDTTAECTELIRQVDTHEAKGDLPNAIMGLRRVINIEPDKAALRVRLAGMYSGLGMTAEAIDECKRALFFNRDAVSIHNMLAKLYLANGALAEAAEQCREVVRLDPENIDARLTLGDLCWNQAKIDEAVDVYEEAVKLAPTNQAPHERLRRLYAARKMYAPALEHLLQLRLLAEGADLDDLGRYKIVAETVREEFDTVLGKLDTARRDFGDERIDRSDYYRECKDAATRIEALAGLLSTMTAPDGYEEAHPHAVLAASLLTQAAGYFVSYLETEKQYYAEQAGLLQVEAKTEMGIFARAVRRA